MKSTKEIQTLPLKTSRPTNQSTIVGSHYMGAPIIKPFSVFSRPY